MGWSSFFHSFYNECCGEAEQKIMYQNGLTDVDIVLKYQVG